MDKNHQNFIKAIHECKILEIKFMSDSKWEIVRKCIPLDFWKSESIKKDQLDRYFTFNIDSNHLLPILPDKIIYINITENSFNPGDYVDLSKRKKWWTIQRNWWIYS